MKPRYYQMERIYLALNNSASSRLIVRLLTAYCVLSQMGL